MSVASAFRESGEKKIGTIHDPKGRPKKKMIAY